MTATLVEPDTMAASEKPAARFLDALGRRDFEELSSLMSPNVWFRALLPRKLYDLDNRQDAVATLRTWFGGAADFRVLETDHHTLAGREYIRYRFLLRPDWAPEQWHVIEQVGFFRVKEGNISRLDLVCTGFFPIEELEEGSWADAPPGPSPPTVERFFTTSEDKRPRRARALASLRERS